MGNVYRPVIALMMRLLKIQNVGLNYLFEEKSIIKSECYEGKQH